MPCYAPLVARSVKGVIEVLGRKVPSIEGTFSKVLGKIELPCGRCAGCRLERSRQWAMRCMHEASLYESNSFLTLTYSDAFLPNNWSLSYSHFQGFMRRLRYEVGSVRFYMCGEYGEVCKLCRKSAVYCKCVRFESVLGRPHYHACLFGVDFRDKKYLRKSYSGDDLFTSELLSRLWYHGNGYIGEVTFESAGYVARYIMDKVTGDDAERYYEYVDPVSGECFSRLPEFSHMSLKPGIGARWLDKYEKDVYPSGRVVVRGAEGMAPRYYDKRWKSKNRDSFELMVFERERKARLNYLDNTPNRLVVKEKVRLAGLKMLHRKID